MENLKAVINLDTIVEKDEYTGELLAYENFIILDVYGNLPAKEVTQGMRDIIKGIEAVTAKYTEAEFEIGETVIEEFLGGAYTVGARIQFDTNKKDYKQLIKELSVCCTELREKYNLQRDALAEQSVMNKDLAEIIGGDEVITKLF